MNYKLITGDCLEKLKKLPDNSVDSIVSDPPSSINFMGQEWDNDKGGRDQWINWLTEIMKECNRVLKPGGHALVWGLPRVSHYTAMGLENAGFEIRDKIIHLFSTGFPKSHNISKAIDKKLGAERKVIGYGVSQPQKSGHAAGNINYQKGQERFIPPITENTTDQAKQWEGWGTALAPSHEEWILCRKPIQEKTISDNVLKYGTGAINIDKSRIGTEIINTHDSPKGTFAGGAPTSNSPNRKEDEEIIYKDHIGRWPKNTIHDGSEPIMEEFDKVGKTKSGYNPKATPKQYGGGTFGGGLVPGEYESGYGDEGSVARFFYCSKPSTKERNMGLDDFEDKVIKGRDEGQDKDNSKYKPRPTPRKNIHPTLKSVRLMSYLINLITPENGIVLDPFMGSGTTGISALLNNYKFVGIEKEKEYMEIAEARIKAFESYRQFLK